MTRRRWNWSIERKLPLLFSVLLLAVVLVMLGAAFQQVRHATLSLATARLKTIAKTYLDLLPLDPATRRTQTATMAADPGVREFVTSGGTRGRDWVLAAMRRIAPDTSSTVVLEVWDTAGHRLILRGDSAWQSDGAPVDQLDSAAVGPYRVRHDTLMYVEVQAAVRQGNEGRVIGRVVQVRRAVLSKRVREFMTGIAGGDVTLLLGNADGDPWTDLEHLIPAPPPEARASVEPTVYQRGEPKFGVAGSIPGTPWKFLVELSQQQLRAPSLAYLRRMSVIAAVIVLVGAFGAWWVSRRITDPLNHLTTAAAAIASGDLAQRVDVPGDDELGRLGHSFNTMAGEVQRARSDLEGQVVERTRALSETNAELEAFSYSVSHDLRAPLRAIHGFARILLEDHGAGMDGEAKRVLGVIDENTRRMGQLIDDLLAFSRLGRKEIETARVDMAELVRGVVDEIRRHAGDRPLGSTVGSLPPARGDRNMLRQP